MVGKGQIKHEITDEKESSVLEGLPRTGGCNLSNQKNFYLLELIRKKIREIKELMHCPLTCATFTRHLQTKFSFDLQWLISCKSKELLIYYKY